MNRVCFLVLATLLAAPAAAREPAAEQPLFTLDERTWVLFYDLPSRRFRAIRDALVRGDLATAGSDLRASAGFVAAEAARADERLVAPLGEVVLRLGELAETIDSPETTVANFDQAFARAHWLLAQHYLVLATRSRDTGRHVSAGNYLWATAHHMERTVIWSDARLTPKLVTDLDRLREMANRLRTSSQPERVYRGRPLVSAGHTLDELGEHLDRRIWTAPPHSYAPAGNADAP